MDIVPHHCSRGADTIDSRQTLFYPRVITLAHKFIQVSAVNAR